MAKGKLSMRVVTHRRSKDVTMFERMSNAIFGSPDARKANGGIKRRFGATVKLRCLLKAVFGGNAHDLAYVIDRTYVSGIETLPRIWLFGPINLGSEDGAHGMFPKLCYDGTGDAGGVRALGLARECMSFANADDSKRMGWMRAAEILLLHSCRLGSIDAYDALGHLYGSDECKKDYFRYEIESRAAHSMKLDTTAIEKRAAYCARIAGSMERDIARGEERVRA